MTDVSQKNNADAYKDTVFLPKTEFPMRGDLPQKEPLMVQKWAEMDLYSAMRDSSKGKEKWILHWGPPYANGNAHIGHAFTKSLKDIVVRCKQMRGYDAPLVPGWDCHGLPIEWKIEEKYRDKGLNKDDVDVLKFRQECREFAQHWADVQSADFQRLGVLADWKDPYMTMKKKSEADIVREIHKFLLNGLLYKGVKPVMWSVVEKTALAEAEVEYKEHKSITVWVKFPVVECPKDPTLVGASVVIWTTTPWTLPSNRAIAFGGLGYNVYTAPSDGKKYNKGDRFIFADTREKDVFTAMGVESWEDWDQKPVSSISLADTKCAHPLNGQGYDFEVPLLFGDFVTSDTGTGFVHMAPSHGEDDYFLYLKHFGAGSIPDNVADDGKYRDHVPLFAGMEVLTQKGEMGNGNFAVLKALDEAKGLLAKGSVKHEYPHSWRSKAPIIFRATPQWFIALDKAAKGATNTLREASLKGIKETAWYPAAGENRITAMIAQRPDWCISRQRTWGVPIALFLNKSDGQPMMDEAVLKRIGDIFEAEGSDAWFARPAQDFLGDKYKADDFDQVFDVVDVWFESGCTHAFVCEARDDLVSPADMYLEGSDQHRGWFHSSLLESCGTRGHAPYKSVLTHGFVLDEKGYKMSKSLGNTVAPEDILKDFGADILRLWTVTSDYSSDVRIGKDAMKNTGDLYRRFRNTFRYLLGAIDGFTPSERIADSEYANMPALEKYILARLAAVDAEICAAIDRHDYNSYIQALHHFCNSDLSSFYFDIRKDRLYCDRPDLFERRAYRTVMAHLFEAMVTWLAPVLPFTTEESWSYRPKAVFGDEASVHLRQFFKTNPEWSKAASLDDWQKILAVRDVVLGALEPKRADKTIGSALEAKPEIYVSAAYEAALKTVDMAEICITSGVVVKSGAAPAGAFALQAVPDVGVVFAKAEGQKCQRCWKILPEVGSDKEYPDLSPRDADAVRWYAQHQKAA